MPWTCTGKAEKKNERVHGARAHMTYGHSHDRSYNTRLVTVGRGRTHTGSAHRLWTTRTPDTHVAEERERERERITNYSPRRPNSVDNIGDDDYFLFIYFFLLFLFHFLLHTPSYLGSCFVFIFCNQTPWEREKKHISCTILLIGTIVGCLYINNIGYTHHRYRCSLHRDKGSRTSRIVPDCPGVRTKFSKCHFCPVFSRAQSKPAVSYAFIMIITSKRVVILIIN